MKSWCKNVGKVLKYAINYSQLFNKNLFVILKTYSISVEYKNIWYFYVTFWFCKLVNDILQLNQRKVRIQGSILYSRNGRQFNAFQ